MMKKVNRILVAIDRSAMAEEALKRAIVIAKEKGAQLFVMHVIESSFIASPFTPSIDENEIEKEIKKRVKKLTSEEDVEYVLFVESGSAASSVTLKGKNLNIDLLIIGTHGKEDISSNYFGSTVLKLIQRTRIPVLIIKNEAKHAYKKILALTNLSDYAKESILFAHTLFNKVALKYLYAYVTIDELMALTYRISADQQDKFKKELLTEADIALEKFAKDVAEGEMALITYEASINEDLLAYVVQDEADLLVLGSKGVGNLNSFLFGSTASYLVRNSPTDVLAYVPTITKPLPEEKFKKEEIVPEKEVMRPKTSPVQKDLKSRKDEIMDDIETFFKENLKFINWNVPEAKDQEIAESLMLILKEKLDEIDQKVQEGKYQEK
ncbi:universal stress protein [Patescibacteria group bacterium]|nr:universal stress protein [Patescibacteria group bacterium]MBU1957360.1 universal stress protein [bacterium]